MMNLYDLQQLKYCANFDREIRERGGKYDPRIEAYKKELQNGFISNHLLSDETFNEEVSSHGFSGIVHWHAQEDGRVFIIEYVRGFTKKQEVADRLDLKVKAQALMEKYAFHQCVIILCAVDKETTDTMKVVSDDSIWRQVESIKADMRSNERSFAGSHCGNCSHSHECTVLGKLVSDVPVDKNVDFLSNEAIRDVMDKAEIIKHWIASVERRAFKLADRKELDGYFIGSARPHRTWIESRVQGVLDDLSDYLDEDVKLMKEVPVTISEIEKMYGKSKTVLDIIEPAIALRKGKPILKKKGSRS